MGWLVVEAMLTRIRVTRLVLGVAAGIFVAPLVLLLLLAIYHALFPGAVIQCVGAAMQTVAACRP